MPTSFTSTFQLSLFGIHMWHQSEQERVSEGERFMCENGIAAKKGKQ